MDLSADDHAKLIKPYTTKKPACTSTQRTATKSSSDGDRGTKTGRGVKLQEANIPITTQKKTPLHYYEISPRPFHPQQTEKNPLVNTASLTRNEMKEEASPRGTKRKNAAPNWSEPQPLDLQAIVREYIRRKEEGTTRIVLSSERDQDEKERLINPPIDEMAVEGSDVVQSGDSVASNEKSQAATPTANIPQILQQQHAKTLKPKGSDVLLGRGRAYRDHPGNKNLKRLVKRDRQQYETARCRDDKTNLSWMIVLEIIGSGGRFLKRNKECSDHWFEVSEEEAREKVSHALRDCRKKPAPSATRTPVTDSPSPSSLQLTAQPVPANAENLPRLLLSAVQHRQQHQPPSSSLANEYR